MAFDISVITAVRNCAGTIEDCITSVRHQTHPVEHIIIDGDSTDGTQEIVERHRADIATFIYEPDKGFYDALNKGLARATSEIIGVLNADDVYANTNILARVLKSLNDGKVDSCYGDLVYIDAIDTGRIRRYWRSGPYHEKRFYQGWMPPHPTFFVRREIYEKYGVFNLDLGTAADYELMLRFLVRHKITTSYIPEVLVKMRMGGQSNVSLKNRLAANRMDRVAWKVNGLKPYPWTLILKPLSKISQWKWGGRS